MLRYLFIRLSKCNFFDCLGENVQIDDFLNSPLKPNETIVQGWCCQFRRVKVPEKEASFLQKFKFWTSIHLSKFTQFTAINNMLFLFEQGILQHQPKNIEDIQRIITQIETLKSLKNDYFISKSSTNSELIDSNLNMIEQEAYALFSKNIKNLGKQEEDKRKEDFKLFQKNAKIIVSHLQEGHTKCIYDMRLLMVFNSSTLISQFNDIVAGIRFRIGLCHTLLYQIKKIEKANLGKFTLISLANDLDDIHVELLAMVYLIESEIYIFTENLKINYFLNPTLDEIKLLLNSLGIDPSKIKESWIQSKELSSDLNDEINKIKNEIQNSKKKYCNTSNK